MKKRSTTAKGHAAMAMAARFFEARGEIIEKAYSVVTWIPKGAARVPISRRHDFFGVWDAIVVPTDDIGRRVYFVQVTEISNVSHRREKILASGFPCTPNDLLMGYRGRGVFRVLRGPRFDEQAEEWKAPPPVKR